MLGVPSFSDTSKTIIIGVFSCNDFRESDLPLDALSILNCHCFHISCFGFGFFCSSDTPLISDCKCIGVCTQLIFLKERLWYGNSDGAFVHFFFQTVFGVVSIPALSAFSSFVSM